MSSMSLSKNQNKFFNSVLKGVLTATSISLVAILIFALALWLFPIPENFIMPINQVIKVISIFFGVKAALKTDASKGLVKGVFVGLFYTVVAFLLFSALSQNFVFNLAFLNDLLFGALLGAISGIIAVNLKR